MTAADTSSVTKKDGASKKPPKPPREQGPKGIVQVTDRITMTDPSVIPFQSRVVRDYVWDAEKCDYERDADGRCIQKEEARFSYAWVLSTPSGSGYYSKGETADPIKHAEQILRDYEQGALIHLLAMPEGKDFYDESEDAPGPYYVLSQASPWHRERWFQKRLHLLAEVLPRQSNKFPGLVAYYQTPQKRAEGVLTPIKPGKFLKKFFGDVLTEEQIQDLGMKWIEWSSPPELKWTQDADEIEAIYSNGPSSCMGKDAAYFSTGGIHPARVYAGPDLGVAWLGDQKDATARAVVWPEKKIYNTVYGDYHRLKMAFAAQGWVEGDLDGARVQRIRFRSGFVMPYVDGCSSAADEDDYLRLGMGRLCTSNTSGWTESSLYSCTVCDEEVDEDDAHHYDGDSYCDCCFHERFRECDVYGDYYPSDDGHDGPNDTWISQDAIDRDRAFYCDATEKAYPMRSYDHVVMADGETWERSHAEEHAFECEFSQEWYPNAERVELSDGRVYAQSATLGITQERLQEWIGEAAIIGADASDNQPSLPLAA